MWFGYFNTAYLHGNKIIKRGDLLHVLPEWKANDMRVYALYPSRKYLAPTVRTFIDFIEEYFNNNQWDF